MVLDRWDLPCLMMERMVNTMALVLWRYPKCIFHWSDIIRQGVPHQHFLASTSQVSCEQEAVDFEYPPQCAVSFISLKTTYGW